MPAGAFTSLQGNSGGPYARNRIAAISTATGNPSAWNPSANGDVYALAISGTIAYAGGAFTHVGGLQRNHVAALDTTVSVNNATAWNPNADEDVRAFALSGTTIYAGGDFTSVGRTARNRLAAIDSDPASATYGRPTAWNPGANDTVHALALSGSALYAGGNFTLLQGSIGGPYTRNRLAAIDTVTANPTAWNPGANDIVYALALSGSALYAGGAFSSLQGSSGGPYARNYLAAIDTVTANPTAWNPKANDAVWTIALSGNTVYAGGEFTSIQGSSGGPYARNNLAAIDASTANPTTWNPDVNNEVFTLALSGTTLYAGGAFTMLQGASDGPYAAGHVAAIDTVTANPTAWNPNLDGPVYTISVTGNTVYAGGEFSTLLGASGLSCARDNIAAISAATGNPTAWNPGADGAVKAIASTGPVVYAGGGFREIGGESCPCLALLPPPATTWYLAEGCTAGGFETWVLVQNPYATGVTVDLTLMTEAGPQNPPDLQDVPVPALSRISFNLGEYVQTL